MKLCKLKKTHRKSEFDCGKKLLNDYLAKLANQDVEKNVAVCYILEGEEDEIIGYFTLSSGSNPKDEIPEKVAQRLPRYTDVPFAVIGRLAVDKKHQGKGFGDFLLVEAFSQILNVAELVGVAGIFVDPIDASSIEFYRKFGFIKLNSSDRMFIPIATVRELFPS